MATLVAQTTYKTVLVYLSAPLGTGPIHYFCSAYNVLKTVTTAPQVQPARPVLVSLCLYPEPAYPAHQTATLVPPQILVQHVRHPMWFEMIVSAIKVVKMGGMLM